jgi:hypothetical protein
MARVSEAGPIYDVADQFRQRCLIEGCSLLWPEHRVWTVANISSLWDAFIQRPDTGKRSFLEKWRDQLIDQPEDVHRVAADSIAFYYLFPSNVGRETKLAKVRSVISWKLQGDQPDLHLLERAYSTKVGSPGPHYLMGQPSQIAFFLDFARGALSGPVDPRNPTACKRLADEVRARVQGSSEARHVLLHLLFPEQFERIGSETNKRQIVEAFRDAAGGAEDLDDALLNIRAVLARRYGREDLDFYDDDIRRHWPRPPTGIRYWKIAPGEHAWNWEACREGSFIAIGWNEMGDISHLTRSEFEKRRDELLILHPDWKKVGVNQLWACAHIKEGDRIVANRGTEEVVGLGTVSGPYYFVPGATYGHRLPVTWDDLAARQVKEPGWRRTVVELDQAKFEEIQKARPLEVRRNPSYSLAECAEDTGFDETILARWVRAIERKGQAIIYGPPGTGKTYAAELLAQHLIGGSDGLLEVVQFHPAYGYEDFIQGIRPKSREDGGLHYPMVPGQFLRFCENAGNCHGRCVLIIDEINRANLARVFGELMYLLEYRDREIPLAGGGRLKIPGNVRVIGTMNTADRSIALVDYALRRRFAFLALYPHYEVLRRYHQQTGFPIEGLINTLERLNTHIGDKHYAVGIAFFLRKDLAEQIADIWVMEIEPYLDEYFFGQEERAEEYRWERVKEKIAS